jgi:hypothetical protein
MTALDALWEQQKDASYKAGIYQGGSEAFASMVIYGECTILGQTVRVSFKWPDDRFAGQVRELSRKILERAYAEGRQAAPPP